MSRFDLELKDVRIHLGVEGSCGGTSIGLHLAANEISKKNRVLWAGEDLPPPQRFSQLFAHVPLTESSRFHAMSFGVKFERTMAELVIACNSLPGVSLVVLDDWCESTGKISIERIGHLQNLLDKIPKSIGLLCISKGGINMHGGDEPDFSPRSTSNMGKIGFSMATLVKSNDGYSRILYLDNEPINLKIKDDGFHRA
ncbi:MAG: hypothetical protein VW230_00810 [Candidatus Poseidoniales archaeon]